MNNLLKKFFVQRSKEKALVEILTLILDATRDGVIDKQEFDQLRKKAYDILLEFNYDKKSKL